MGTEEVQKKVAQGRMKEGHGRQEEGVDAKRKEVRSSEKKRTIDC